MSKSELILNRTNFEKGYVMSKSEKRCVEYIY